MPTFRTTDLAGVLIPAVVGAGAFVMVTSGAILAPSNISWLTQGDPAVSYLGWAFYRHSPWSLPLGGSPDYGLDVHSSVYYSDSIPLLAIAFKLASPWLPEPFQYFGMWVLLCFVMQGVFAWMLAGLVSQSYGVRTAAVVFFVFAPPMLNRINAHMALVGHWIILAAIYMCLRPSRVGQAWRWALIVAGAIGIHAYLFAMAAALWGADLIGRYVESRRAGSPRRYAPLLAEGLAIPILAVVVAWQCGFFMVPSHGMGTFGFGYYKMNLLAPFDSRGWSAFLPALGGSRGEREGLNYLGLGGLLLVVLAAITLATRPLPVWSSARTARLLSLAVALTLVAITHNVGVGGHQFSIPLPQRLETMLEVSPLQSTGRLFWVVYYLLLYTAMLVLARTLRARSLLPLLAVTAVVQLVDLYPALRDLRHRSAVRAASPPADALTGPFWEHAADKYTKVRQLPARIGADGWERAALYAQRHGMATDMVKLARVDWYALKAAQSLQRVKLLMGRSDPDALYLVGAEYLDLVRASLTNPDDALFRLDGFNVLVPSWGRILPEGALNLRSACAAGACETPSAFRLPFRSDFAPASVGRMLLGEGWYSGGANRVRSRANAATIFIPGGAARFGVDVTLFLAASVSDRQPVAAVDVYASGERIATARITDDREYLLNFRVPSSAAEGNFHHIVLRAGHPDGKTEAGGQELRIDLDRLEVKAAAR
jgi:hypothetical protein